MGFDRKGKSWLCPGIPNDSKERFRRYPRSKIRADNGRFRVWGIWAMKGGAREKRPPPGVEKRMLIFGMESIVHNSGFWRALRIRPAVVDSNPKYKFKPAPPSKNPVARKPKALT